MKTITIRGLALQVDVDDEALDFLQEEAIRAIHRVNALLEREYAGISAHLFGEDQLIIQAPDDEYTG